MKSDIEFMKGLSTTPIGSRWQHKYSPQTRIVEIVDSSGGRVKLKTLVNVVIFGKHKVIYKTKYETNASIEYFTKTYKQLNGYCHKCQLARGAKMPKAMHVTISEGTCKMCMTVRVGLVPDCDYNWPDGRKAVFD